MNQTHSNLNDSLDNIGIEFSKSFSEGVLFALNCSQLSKAKLSQRFIDLVTSLPADDDEGHAILTDLIETSLDEMQQTLSRSPFGYEPIFDKTDLVVESESVKDWAGGFFLGINDVKADLIGKLSETSREFLSDIESIASMPTLEVSDESSEVDLVEIEEYLRMGAIGVYFDSRNDDSTNWCF